MSTAQDIIQLSQVDDYNFEIVAALADCLHNSYRLVRYFPEVYAVSINRLQSLYCKLRKSAANLVESIFHRSKEMIWNALELLRSVSAISVGEDNPLLDKLAVTFGPRMEDILCRVIMFEARVRARLLWGYTVLLVRCSARHELLPRVISELLLIMNNLTDYEPICESVGALVYILKETQQSQHVFNRLLKNCNHVIQGIFRLEYLSLLTNTLILAEHCNNRLKYEISLRALEISRSFQQPYTRMVILKRSLRNLNQISKHYPHKR